MQNLSQKVRTWMRKCAEYWKIKIGQNAWNSVLYLKDLLKDRKILQGLISWENILFQKGLESVSKDYKKYKKQHDNFLHDTLICIVKAVYKNHPQDPKIGAVVDSW